MKETQEIFSQDLSLCKRTIEVGGKWRVGVHYGPQFEILLQTEKAGEILIQTDETIILGGGGTSFHPVALCIAGFTGCIAIDFAKWAAMLGINLRNFKIISRMFIDLTTGFGIEADVPMIDDFVLEFYVDSDADMEKLNEVLSIVEKRCLCYNCYVTPIFPNVIVTKTIPEKEEKVELELPIHIAKEIDLTLEKLQFNAPHNIKRKTAKGLKMSQL